MATDRTRGSRSPALSVLADGVVVPGAVDARVVTTNYYSADWFQASFVPTDNGHFDLSYWLSVDSPLIEVRVKPDRNEPFETLIIGNADMVTADPGRRMINVSGRDLSSLMIDSCIHRTFPNQSASEIATFLASYHGLNPNVQPTPDLAGRKVDNFQNVTVDAYYSRFVTDWDIIVHLATQYGYDTYVRGRSFYFCPVGFERSPSVRIEPGQFTQFRLHRDLAIERRAGTSHVSWNAQLQQEVTLSVESDRGRGSNNRIRVLEPNLSPDSLGMRISRLVNDPRRQSIGFQATMLGDVNLTARSKIILDGLASEIGGAYEVESIDRTFSPTGGFLQRIRATRSPVQS